MEQTELEIPAEKAAEEEEEEKESEVTEPTAEEKAAEEEKVSEVTEPTAEEKAAAAEQKKQERKQTAQERIDQITKARREVEREKEYWKSVALQKTNIPEEEPAPKVEIPKPKLEQYESIEDYTEAMFSWKEQQNKAIEARRAREDTKIKAEQKRLESEKQFMERAEKFRKNHPDFDDVIAVPVFTGAMRQVILELDNGAILAYHLGLPENKKTAEKISTLPVHLQIYELAKLETQLLLAEKSNKTPGAPPPINPLNSGTGSELNKDTSKMSEAEFYAYDEAKKRAEVMKKYNRR